MVSRIVCCRAGMSRAPPVRRRRRSLICASSAAGESAALWAAASSIARGKPSRCRQRSATVVALAVSTSKAGRTARARATKRRTASVSAMVGAAHPPRVGRAGRPETAARRAPAVAHGWWPAPEARGSPPAAPRPGPLRPPKHARSCRAAAGVAGVAGRVRWLAHRRGRGSALTSRPAATAVGTSAGSARGARSTQTTPSAKCAATSWAICQGEAGLAHATGTGQRQQRHRLLEQQRARGGELRLPADEAGARDGGTFGEGRSEAAATTRASFVSNDRVDVVAPIT